MNKVFLVGRITKDPELRNSSNGTPYCFFTVAINRIGTVNGERVADFISCVAWRNQAENLCKFIHKGGLIGVDGKIQSRSTTDQNGANRTIMEVVCDNISFLESKSQANDQGMSNSYGNYSNNNNYGSQMNNQRPQYNQNSYNNNYNNNNNYQGYQANQNSAPRRNEPTNENPFAGEVKSQFNISDDDLPF